MHCPSPCSLCALSLCPRASAVRSVPLHALDMCTVFSVCPAPCPLSACSCLCSCPPSPCPCSLSLSLSLTLSLALSLSVDPFARPQTFTVYGYECLRFRDDALAAQIANGEMLMPWHGEADLMIDRSVGLPAAR